MSTSPRLSEIRPMLHVNPRSTAWGSRSPPFMGHVPSAAHHLSVGNIRAPHFSFLGKLRVPNTYAPGQEQHHNAVFFDAVAFEIPPRYSTVLAQHRSVSAPRVRHTHVGHTSSMKVPPHMAIKRDCALKRSAPEAYVE